MQVFPTLLLCLSITSPYIRIFVNDSQKLPRALIILWYTPLVQFVELFILKRVCLRKENRLDDAQERDLQTEDNSMRTCLVKTALLPSFSQVEHATTTRMVLKGTHSPSGCHLFSAPPCQNTQDFKDHDDLQLSSLLT